MGRIRPDWPAEIEVIELDRGVRFVLPRRHIPRAGLIGRLLIGKGAAIAIVGAWFISTGVRGLARGGGAMSAAVDLAFATPFAGAGGVILFLGLLVLRGWSEVSVEGGWIRAIERGAGVPWVRRRRAEFVSRLKVGDVLTPAAAEGRPELGFSPDYSAIRADVRAGKPLIIAPGYPRPVLAALAQELAVRCALEQGAQASGAPPIDVEVMSDSPLNAVGEADAAAPERPAGSGVTIARARDAFTMHVPSAGLWRGSKGLLTLSIFWCGFMAVFSASMMAPLFSGGGARPPALAYLVILAFWAVGIGMLLSAIHMGSRRAIIDVLAREVLVTEAGLFGASSRHWMREDVLAVRSGPSPMEVNDRPVNELQLIVRTAGVQRKIGLFAGREDEELRWMAGALREAIGVGPHPEMPRSSSARQVESDVDAASREEPSATTQAGSCR